jgi:SAM-dependent methyltransferase
MPHGPIECCQICGAQDLRSALFLGFLPPVNSMRALDAPADSEPWHPAELLVCPSCHLAQLGYVVEPAVLFPPEYPYTSGSTRVLRENFAELHQEVDELVGLTSADLVVDVGSNDGTLLAAFRDDGHRVLGIEPTRTAEIARDRGIETMSAFFDAEAASEAVSRHGTARVVTAANVFAHIPDIHAVVEAIASMLAPNGVFVSESGYFRDLVETLQYDTIYHEHLRYYSLTSLSALLEAHGFRVVHAKRIPTHGGSIRVYATRDPELAVQSSVAELLEEEMSAGLTDESWVDAFRERVTQSKLDLYRLLAEIKGSGGRIYGIGAPSRASTLVNYVGLDDGIVNYVLEIAGSMKVGKYLPGTAIPVVEESKLFEDQPEFALLLSWHIGGELKANLRKKGFAGRFIVPLPEPRIET